MSDWSTRRVVQVAALLVLLAAGRSEADLLGVSHSIRGGHVSASATAGPVGQFFSGSGALGQSEAIGLSGSTSDLRTSAPGFLPIVAGSFTHLDLDGDGVAYFLDDDDDGDGLDDVVETNTGVFASSSDTGTDSLIADTDGDGFPDGVEVAAGSDPNSGLSIPRASQLPALNPLSRGLAVLALTLASIWALLLGRRKRT